MCITPRMKGLSTGLDDRLGPYWSQDFRFLTSRKLTFGISYGRVVASRLAMRSPENGKLVLMASAPWFSVEGKRQLQRQIDLMKAGDRIALLREFTSMFRSPWLNLLVGFRVRLSGNRMVKRLGKPEVIRRYLEAMVEARVRTPNIKTSIFEGETHMVPVERAKAVKQIVSDFFSSRSSSWLRWA